MKLLIFDGIHISSRGHAYNRPYYLGKALDFLEDTIKSENPDMVINLGDTLDIPFIKDTITLKYFLRFVDVCAKAKKNIHILGSHSTQSLDDELSLMSILGHIPNNIIVDTSYKIGNMGFLSHHSDVDEFIKDNTECDLLFTHHEIRPEVAKKYPKIQFINGHIHLGTSIADINVVNNFYPGAILLNVGDYFENPSDYEAPGILIWDTENSFNTKKIYNPETVHQFRSVIKYPNDIYNVSAALTEVKSKNIRLRVVNKCEDIGREDVQKILDKFEDKKNINHVFVNEVSGSSDSLIEASEESEGKYTPSEELSRIIKSDFDEYFGIYKEASLLGGDNGKEKD